MRVERDWRARLRLNLRYATRLLRSVAPALSFCTAFFILGAALIKVFDKGGEGGVGEALYTMYFLMLGEPVFSETPDHLIVEAIAILAPLVGIMVVFDLLARFSLHVFSKKTNQREWVTVVASTYENHTILCGLGRVGTKVLEELLALGEPVVCIESDESAMGVAIARESGHPVFIGDARRDAVLEEAGVTRARAVLALTDQDLVNLEVVLDARKMKPGVRAIARIFEQELGGKIEQAFDLDGVYSTSTLAAPFFAVASLDPEIVNAYDLAGELCIVAETEVHAGQGLEGTTVRQALDEQHISVLTCVRRGERLTLRSELALAVGDRVTFQTGYEAFKRWRREHPVQGAPPRRRRVTASLNARPLLPS